MTRARATTLAICVPVALSLIGWGAFSAVAAVGTGQYTFSTPVSVSGGKLTADVSDGGVTLKPGNTARLAGTVTYSLVRPHLTVSGSEVSYQCVVPAGDCGMQSTLTVPPSATAVNLSSSTGDLTVNGGISSDLTLSTTTGDLTANGLTGTANLSSEVGDITASGITASDVTVRSSTGNVTLTFTKVPRDVKVTSNIGDISIVLPHANYRFQVSSSIGDTSYPTSDPSSGNLVAASTSTGDVSVSES
jgi:hypothetical protein